MAGRRNSSAIAVGGIPRAQLLPPDVAQRRLERGRIRTLGAVVVIVIVIVAGVYGLSTVQAIGAQNALLEAQNQTLALTAQQSTYAPAKNAGDSIAQIEEALKVVTSSEVSWSDLDAVVERHLVNGDHVVNASFTGRAPFDPVLPISSSIATPKVAIMAITVAIASPDDVAPFMNALRQEDTVADVAFVSLGGGTGQYTADFRIDFNVRALWHRTFTEETSK